MLYEVPTGELAKMSAADIEDALFTQFCALESQTRFNERLASAALKDLRELRTLVSSANDNRTPQPNESHLDKLHGELIQKKIPLCLRHRDVTNQALSIVQRAKSKQRLVRLFGLCAALCSLSVSIDLVKTTGHSSLVTTVLPLAVGSLTVAGWLACRTSVTHALRRQKTLQNRELILRQALSTVGARIRAVKDQREEVRYQMLKNRSPTLAEAIYRRSFYIRPAAVVFSFNR